MVPLNSTSSVDAHGRDAWASPGHLPTCFRHHAHPCPPSASTSYIRFDAYQLHPFHCACRRARPASLPTARHLRSSSNPPWWVWSAQALLLIAYGAADQLISSAPHLLCAGPVLMRRREQTRLSAASSGLDGVVDIHSMHGPSRSSHYYHSVLLQDWKNPEADRVDTHLRSSAAGEALLN